MDQPVTAKESEIHFCHGIFRINTDISSGDQNIDKIIECAKKDTREVDYIVVTDQFLVYAKYGIPPFREVLAYSKARNSVVSYGIEKYLARIEEADKDNPELEVIPGVDIAPHYYWTGIPFTKSFTANQFSEQITVFGPNSADFYRNLPVIHNGPSGFFFPGTIICLLPLLISLAGASLFIKHNKKYRDQQGHTYKLPGTVRFKVLAVFLILIGLLWTFNNRPFHKRVGSGQYSQSTQKEYQEVFDYIRKVEEEPVGVIWSAPEVTMKETRSYASLLSVPFIDDIKHTYGYNGFAGIYGDVSSAHKPGSFWDYILKEYCEGKRKLPPIIVGERDWHGRGELDLDFIKTVTISRKRSGKPNKRQIIDAIISGHSYAVAQIAEREIILDNVRLINEKENTFAIPGETLRKADDELVLKIEGDCVSESSKDYSNTAILIVVVDGEEYLSKEFELNPFNLSIPVNIKKKDWTKHYVRFYIIDQSAPALICNPIFIKD